MDKDPKQQAFEALLQPILRAAFGLALQMVRNRDEAEDLVQETSLLAYRAFHTFETGTNFKAWFFKILMNCSIQRYRRARHYADVDDIDEVPEQLLYQCMQRHGSPSGQSDLSARVLDKIEADQIIAAIFALPEEYRIVSSLYFVEEFSYQDIAQIAQIPIGTVRSRLHRARRLLQRALWELIQDRDIKPTGA